MLPVIASYAQIVLLYVLVHQIRSVSGAKLYLATSLARNTQAESMRVRKKSTRLGHRKVNLIRPA